MFTEYGEKMIETVRNEYNSIAMYYDPYLGNFGFTETEFLAHLDTIKRFLENNTNYFIVYQNIEDDIEQCWFVTDFN